MGFCAWPEGCESYTEGNSKFCGTHNHILRKEKRTGKKHDEPYVIPGKSDKKKLLDAQYLKERSPWIKGKMCAVFPTLMAQECHHQKGRDGFADKWARDNNVPLILDKRFWLPVSVKGHRMITLKPQWALKMGYSLPRTEKMD
jgi:hypothetical protein